MVDTTNKERRAKVLEAAKSIYESQVRALQVYEDTDYLGEGNDGEDDDGALADQLHVHMSPAGRVVVPRTSAGRRPVLPDDGWYACFL